MNIRIVEKSPSINPKVLVKKLLDLTQAGMHISKEAKFREYLLKAYREYKILTYVSHTSFLLLSENIISFSSRYYN